METIYRNTESFVEAVKSLVEASFSAADAMGCNPEAACSLEAPTDMEEVTNRLKEGVGYPHNVLSEECSELRLGFGRFERVSYRTSGGLIFGVVVSHGDDGSDSFTAYICHPSGKWEEGSTLLASGRKAGFTKTWENYSLFES